MRDRRHRLGWIGCLVLAQSAWSAEPISLSVTMDRPDGLYTLGEEARFTVTLSQNGAPGTGTVRFRFGGDARPRRIVDVPYAGEPVTVGHTLDRPGWIHCEAQVFDADGNPIAPPRKRWPIAAKIGAMVSPELIREAISEPDDFDAFWQQRRNAVTAVPLRAMRKAYPQESEREGEYDAFAVTADCAGDHPVSGVLVIPRGAAAKSLAAVVKFHAAGVHSAGPYYEPGALTFDVNAHGIENGHPRAYYEALWKNGALKGYNTFGADDPEKNYFGGMFQRAMRALDYVKSLPEWDGKSLIVRGTSQGGAQALAAAALDPGVTLCVVAVPAMADHNAEIVGRSPGWPHFNRLDGTDGFRANVLRTAAYFDMVNFAKRIRGEVVMGIGLLDMACPPNGLYAAFNAIPEGVKKTMTPFPTHGHSLPKGFGDREVAHAIRRKGNP